MNYKMMGRFIAQILAIEAAFMIPALLISAFGGEKAAAMGFVYSIMIIVAVAALLWLFCRGAKKGFYAKEGLTCTGISWLVMSLLGCLPFVISGEIPNYIDALFEIVSGFTTTGASIVPAVEELSKGVLYWRSFSHWVGGMGVLVFLLAVIPVSEQKGGFTMHLLRAESPGPNVGKLVPRMKQTAMILYVIYILLTVLNVIFLLLGKMPVFDAVCTAFGTAGTGGFGVKNDSIAGYSPYIQNVTTIFMLLFGINFSCYYLLLMRQLRSVFKDEELRMYLGIVVVSIVLIVINLRGVYETLGETIRHAAFQVATIITTTGYATTDFDLWPGFSKAILLCLMVVGASAGSTGGGMKCGRVLLLLKILRRNIRQVLYPNRVMVVRNNDDVVDEKVLQNTNGYLAAYVFITIFSFIIISIDGFSIETNISAVLACFNNIGPGFDAVGPVMNYASYSWLSKLVLIFDMLAGRLEIFPILVLFSGSTWRNK
ncbi:MAG: TrkH family potassium uptake protein [Oscillospiraceae bacterium]|nr:TrkH family potassium uptake protein [Oscillospiraceae bacterium]